MYFNRMAEFNHLLNPDKETSRLFSTPRNLNIDIT